MSTASASIDPPLAAATAAAASFAALESKLGYLDTADIEQVRQAYRFADTAHLGQLRHSGEPYITHPIAVAAQVAEWKLDEAKFTPELWKRISDQRLPMQIMAKSLGEVRSVELLSRSGSGGSRTYRYHAVFANGGVNILMTLDGGGKISAMAVDEE